MLCRFIGLYEGEKLIGVALAQFLDLNLLESFGERDQCLKTTVRNFVFRHFASHVLFIGNNMLTGQHAFKLHPEANPEKASQTLYKAAEALKIEFAQLGKKVHITTYKDFDAAQITQLDPGTFASFYQFTTQPNMVFYVRENWKSEQDYVSALNKKYRDQYKRARKKELGIEKRRMSLDEIEQHQEQIYQLYFHVAKNAPFNTFFLAQNHFKTFKSLFKEDFLFYGYYLNQKLIGFNTMIVNGDSLDTYFLGYDDSVQREKMLYLNMLYDMIACAIHNKYREVVFSRTALEIKSSVGAVPIQTFGYLEHKNALVNRFMPTLFGYLEPEVQWNPRNPFQ
jgi:predicted N-acyltransferase